MYSQNKTILTSRKEAAWMVGMITLEASLFTSTGMSAKPST
jgi:hypothetical protein